MALSDAFDNALWVESDAWVTVSCTSELICANWSWKTSPKLLKLSESSVVRVERFVFVLDDELDVLEELAEGVEVACEKILV